MFNVDLHTTILYLFTMYGSITTENQKEEKNTFYAKRFDIKQPLVILLNNLDKLEQLAISANNPYTGTHIVNIDIQLTKNFNDIEKFLAWLGRPEIQHTLLDFKTHLER